MGRTGGSDAMKPLSERDDIVTPFTAQQVLLLNRFQQGEWMPSFTCGWRDQHPANAGVLIATADGWRCPVRTCHYMQLWAHWWMADAAIIEECEAAYRRQVADAGSRSEVERG